MSQSNVLQADFTRASILREPAAWLPLCRRSDLVANSGVVAWHEGVQVALFHLDQGAAGERLFAIENRDPKSGANVIGRGILIDADCLEDAEARACLMARGDEEIESVRQFWPREVTRG